MYNHVIYVLNFYQVSPVNEAENPVSEFAEITKDSQSPTESTSDLSRPMSAVSKDSAVSQTGDRETPLSARAIHSKWCKETKTKINWLGIWQNLNSTKSILALDPSTKEVLFLCPQHLCCVAYRDCFVISFCDVGGVCRHTFYSGQCLKNGLSDLIEIWHVDVTAPQGVLYSFVTLNSY